MSRNKVDIGETMGMIRRIDELGRIVLPQEHRKVLGINELERQHLEMFLIKDEDGQPEGLFIRKAKFTHKGEE